jgi:hypothetical protein
VLDVFTGSGDVSCICSHMQGGKDGLNSKHSTREIKATWLQIFIALSKRWICCLNRRDEEDEAVRIWRRRQ